MASLFLLSFLVLNGCGEYELDSLWRGERSIVIDGESSDWLGTLVYLEDENFSVGILNDENFLYVCLLTENQFMRTQMMRMGFTLWFDSEGGKDKSFGIRFPLGMPAREPGLKRGEDEQDREKMRRNFMRSQKELVILGPKESRSRRILIAEVEGIEVRTKSSSGLLVYELKVPLIKTREFPYAIGTRAGEVIGLGFEIPKIERSNMRNREGGGMGGRGGIGGGGRGGRGGGMGGMRGGGKRSGMPKALKLWIKVHLEAASNINR